jgi:hypothetical protein
MFIETHVDTLPTTGQIALTFVKSASIKAFPCGRRRSAFIGVDLNSDGVMGDTEGYRIPFDPEARLNTEANNRKHSSLNGYTQTYLNGWDSELGTLSLALAGYLFNITLENEFYNETAFGNGVAEAIKNKLRQLATSSNNSFDENTFDINTTHIYANILIEKAKLFTGFQDYDTEVLCNQSADDAEPVLDLLIDTTYDPKVPDSYYFSGLSFSTEPLTGIINTISVLEIPESGQTVISLQFLKKDDTVWKICPRARLPKVWHGPTEESVEVDDLYTRCIITPSARITKELSVQAYGDINLTENAEAGYTGSINARKLMQNGKQVPMIDLVQDTDINGNECWQLQINLSTK